MREVWRSGERPRLALRFADAREFGPRRAVVVAAEQCRRFGSGEDGVQEPASLPYRWTAQALESFPAPVKGCFVKKLDFVALVKPKRRDLRDPCGHTFKIIGEFERLVERALSRKERPDLIVWPETAYPFGFITVNPAVDAKSLESQVR